MTRCLNLGDTPALVSASSSSKFGVTAIEGSRRVISDSYSAGLNASWEADLFGRNRGNLAAAGESLNAVHAALAGEITTAYTSHRGDQARASVPALRESIARTGNLLARLSGREPGSLDALLSSTGRGIPDPPRRLAVGIPADTDPLFPALRSEPIALSRAFSGKQIPCG